MTAQRFPRFAVLHRTTLVSGFLRKKRSTPSRHRRCCGYQIRECPSTGHVLPQNPPLSLVVSFRSPLFSGCYGNMGTSFSPFVSSSPNIRFIFCTACPAAPFTRLSMGPHHDHPMSPRIDFKIHIHIVAALHPFRLGAHVLIQHPDKKLILIIFVIGCFYLFIGKIASQGSVSRDEDATVHGHQMRRKIDQHRFSRRIGQLLLDLPGCAGVPPRRKP